ncbi:UNVERIFIED_CONTAM: hypothetical protein Sradi_7009100 [Sesamum radiatum]|uniref:Uncharacterized protein n=1 Tax=Sesamum radiatum TaxID=300843 RepID=A0AAW2JBR0_SESRA
MLLSFPNTRSHLPSHLPLRLRSARRARASGKGASAHAHAAAVVGRVRALPPAGSASRARPLRHTGRRHPADLAGLAGARPRLAGRPAAADLLGRTGQARRSATSEGPASAIHAAHARPVWRPVCAHCLAGAAQRARPPLGRPASARSLGRQDPARRARMPGGGRQAPAASGRVGQALWRRPRRNRPKAPGRPPSNQQRFEGYTIIKEKNKTIS